MTFVHFPLVLVGVDGACKKNNHSLKVVDVSLTFCHSPGNTHLHSCETISALDKCAVLLLHVPTAPAITVSTKDDGSDVEEEKTKQNTVSTVRQTEVVQGSTVQLLNIINVGKYQYTSLWNQDCVC